MFDAQTLRLGAIAAAAMMAAVASVPAWGQVVGTPDPALRTPGTIWLAQKYGGAAPSHAADPPAIVTIDGFRYGLAQSALGNLDAVRVLLVAADAIGMIRNNDYENPTHNTVGGSTHAFEYRATGTVNGAKASVVVGFDYRGPSVRAATTGADNKTEIQVASGNLAWDESKPGVYSAPAKTSANDRLLQLYLLPPAVVQAAVPTIDKIKLATKNGMRELTIPIARFSSELRATLNGKDEIIHTEMTVGGKLYSADFSDYKNDKMDFHVMFPHRIIQKVDGTTVADLTLTEHWVGPYMVWPLPKEVAAK